jgi:hypothetical protein
MADMTTIRRMACDNITIRRMADMTTIRRMAGDNITIRRMADDNITIRQIPIRRIAIMTMKPFEEGQI